MSNILVIYGTGIRSKISREFVNTQLRFIDTMPQHNFYFGSFAKLVSINKILDVKNIKEVIDMYSYFKEHQWGKGFKQLDEIIEKYNIEQVYMYGMSCIQNNDNEVAQLEEIYEKSSDPEYMGYSNFEFLFRHIKFHITPYYIGKRYNIPVHQFVNDPLEIDFTGKLDNYYRWSFLTNTKNATFHPYIDYGHTRREIPRNLEKSHIFIFGSSDLPSYDSKGYRTKLIDELLEVENKQNPKFKYMVKSKRHNIDTTLRQDEYNKLIEKSYFSYVIPSHDNNSFSFIRFLDIIHSGTIPLIAPECNIDCAFNCPLRQELLQLVNKYKLVKSVNEIEQLLNVSEENLNKFLNMFLDEYMNTQYYKSLHK